MVFPGRSITIQDAFNEIEEQTPYLISVNHTNFDISKKVRISAADISVKEAMTQLLRKSGRTFLVNGTHILVVPSDEKLGEDPSLQITQAEEEVPGPVDEAPVAGQRLDPAVPFAPETRYQPAEIPFTYISQKGSLRYHRDMAMSVMGRMNYLSMPPRFAVKINLLYGLGTLTPNLGFEIGLGGRSTLNLTGSYNPWKLDDTSGDNKKLAHWLASAEYRFWTCQRFNGHFIGVHGFYGEYNIAGRKIPMLFEKNSDQYRYKGNIIGAGVSYGYHWMIGKNWNVEFNLGVGYGYMTYDKFQCPRCGDKLESDVKRNYFGVTKAGISLVYMIK